MKDSIDDDIEKLLKEETAQSQAVKSLIEVREKKKGEVGSEIELKTDLDKNQVCIHTAVDMITNIIDMDEKEFTDKCIIGNLINLKERKLLSKDRKSRTEIVEVAKTPDMMFNQEPQQGFVRNLFRSRRKDNL